MISKLIPEENVLEHGVEWLHNRMSGDTTGLALSIIGNLMQLGKPYTACIKGYTHNTAMDMRLLDKVVEYVRVLGLQHFVFLKKDLKITYDIWRKPKNQLN